MESSSDVQMSHCDGDSETMIEIKIKTLDSQTYNLRVNKCVPVPLLKEKIATVTGILSEQQRLICRGRVLKDDELLSAYHVEDGHTLHLVVRQPGQSATSGNAGTEANTSNSSRRRGPTVARSIVVEAVNVDHVSSELPSFATQLLQSLLGLFSTQSLGAPAPSDTRPSESTQSSIPDNVIPDALTTISQYIHFMRDSFRREGFNQNGQTQGYVEHRTAGSSSVGGTRNQESQSDSAATLGLPTAALLAETMHSTRQIVVDQAGALLSQLSTQLGDLVNVTDSATWRNLQSSALRSGVLLQNLGSLLLELGRTTMMLRVNPASSEAVVNSGPALYISPSGPNPILVQEGLSKWVQYFLVLVHKALFSTQEMLRFMSTQTVPTQVNRLVHNKHSNIQIGQEMLRTQILVKHLQGLQVVILFLLSLELDCCHLEQWLPCLLASVVLLQGHLVEELVLSIHCSPEFSKEQTIMIVMKEMVNLQLNMLVVAPILTSNLFINHLKLMKQVIWELQLMSMWEIALTAHLGSRLAFLSSWTGSIISYLDHYSLEKMVEKMAQVSKHQWLLLSRQMLQIVKHQKCQESVRRAYTSRAWSDKLCHLFPKLKHSIRVLHQTVAALLHRLHLTAQTEQGMAQVIPGVCISITVTESMSLILKGKEPVIDSKLHVSRELSQFLRPQRWIFISGVEKNGVNLRGRWTV